MTRPPSLAQLEARHAVLATRTALDRLRAAIPVLEELAEHLPELAVDGTEATPASDLAASAAARVQQELLNANLPHLIAACARLDVALWSDAHKAGE